MHEIKEPQFRAEPETSDVSASAGDRFLDEARRNLMCRYDVLKTDRMQAVLRVQDTLFRSVRDEMHAAGYLELQAPIIGPATDPGIRGAGQVSFDYYGTEFKIMSSMILYKQMAANSLGKIYSFSPNVRLEPASSALTGRHLAEFYQIDMEEADGTMESVMARVEGLLAHVSRAVAESCAVELSALGRRLLVPDDRFKVYKYDEVWTAAGRAGCSFEYGQEVTWEAEAALSEKERLPFWIRDYPVGSRGFYYAEDPEKPGRLLSMDLIYPEGFGEGGSGGVREYQHARVTNKMLASGDDPGKYGWYMKMLKSGIKPSAGIGLGVERMTRYLTGQKSILCCSPFPKLPGIASP